MPNESGRWDTDLPPEIARNLSTFLDAAREALGPDLRSAVLYGSAAEGRVRATSDVNLVLVLSRFDPERMDRLRDPYRTAHAAIQLGTMLLLEEEIAPAVEAFAVKFGDILRRRRVVFGEDPFAGMTPSRGAEIARLKQVLLNLTLRLREQYLLRSLRDEQAARILADAVGPLRAAAAALLELQGKPVGSPREALAHVVATIPGGWDDVLARMTDARENRPLPPGAAAAAVLRLVELAAALRARVEEVKP